MYVCVGAFLRHFWEIDLALPFEELVVHWLEGLDGWGKEMNLHQDGELGSDDEHCRVKRGGKQSSTCTQQRPGLGVHTSEPLPHLKLTTDSQHPSPVFLNQQISCTRSTCASRNVWRVGAEGCMNAIKGFSRRNREWKETKEKSLELVWAQLREETKKTQN